MIEQVDVVDTEFGWIALLGRGGRLRAVGMGHASAEAARRYVCRRATGPVDRCRWDPDLVERLVRFAAGEPMAFSDIALDLDHLTPFARRVTKGCQSIPWGATVTYGALARQCGSPGAARAVGNVMAHNRFPLIVPCHRVVPAGGKLGGFSAAQGVAMKERLLRLEGARPEFSGGKLAF
jgi:methylated-DNA-[protein]-cysteine S-methyltransferase